MKTLLVCAALAAVSVSIVACNQDKKDDTKAEKDDDKDDKKGDKKKGGASASPSAKESAGAGAKTSAPTAAPATAAPAPETAAPAPPPAPTAADVTKPNLGTPEKPVMSPTQQTYSMDGIKTIPDTCSNAHVILTQAPESVGVDYEWKYSRQAMLANQQYQVVDGKPSLPGQVSFQVHQADAKLSNAWVLVANCADGTTCNHLAAMYKSIVKSSNPQVFCGDVPAHLGPMKKAVNLMAGGWKANLPATGDTISQCARLAACTIADKTDTKEDVGINCQKSPQSFKLNCADRYPCAEVLACTK
ncbi:MAG: hypothetical protein IPG04_19790 [Polyangiaceae bacterium]|nr:hypothetical protein [Polyangiaceae bacterium]